MLYIVCHFICYSVPEFEASQYPVINGEFLEFVESGGYQNRQLWTDEGKYSSRDWNVHYNSMEYVQVGSGWSFALLVILHSGCVVIDVRVDVDQI